MSVRVTLAAPWSRAEDAGAGPGAGVGAATAAGTGTARARALGGGGGGAGSSSQSSSLSLIAPGKGGERGQRRQHRRRPPRPLRPPHALWMHVHVHSVQQRSGRSAALPTFQFVAAAVWVCIVRVRSGIRVNYTAERARRAACRRAPRGRCPAVARARRRLRASPPLGCLVRMHYSLRGVRLRVRVARSRLEPEPSLGEGMCVDRLGQLPDAILPHEAYQAAFELLGGHHVAHRRKQL